MAVAILLKSPMAPLVNDGGSSQGSSWGDYDNDGDRDLFVSNAGENNFLYRNDGSGNFVKISNSPVVTDGGNSTGSSWADYDNDGDLDLFVANSSNENNFLYCNDGSGNFVKITSEPIVTDGGDSDGSSWADYDNDGDLDLFISNAGGDNFLYRNNGNSNNWVNIELIGTTSNTSAIGAKIKIKATINDQPVWQIQEISGQTGSLSQNSLNAEFGLGDATMIDSIRIEWPSGLVQEATDIVVNQHLTITEAKSSFFNQAQFTADPTKGAPPLTVSFINQTIANPSVVSWWWDFDNDGTIDSQEQNPSYTYSDLGVYSVRLIVSNGVDTDTLTKSKIIFVDQFTKITTGDIVTDSENSYGSSWADYDNDGDLDLFVANSGNNSLYQNNGDDSFTKIIGDIIVNDGGASRGSSWGDYDNDGDLDLFVSNAFGSDNYFYKNNGDISFTKITDGVTVNDGGNSYGCGWGDYDNDGNIDLFVANDGGGNNFLYHNDGNGNFVKIQNSPVVNDGGFSWGSSWGDYDNDGDIDLFVANTDGNNFLYRNDGSGNFAKITSGPVVNDRGESLGGSWGDYDNDGDIDLFVANTDGNNFLYRNEGSGSFLKIISGPVVSDSGSSWGSSWGDYDNDGDLDLFVANLGPGNNFLYQNNGNGTFTKITSGVIANESSSSLGSSWGDYDNDGDLDLFVANGVLDKNNFLFENNGNSNHWINIYLLGTVSNASAIGARVSVKAIINGIPVWQVREISGQTGFLGQNSLNAEFGLGDAVVIDSIRIEWPSKEKEVYTTRSVNAFLKFTENKNLPPFVASAISDITLSRESQTFILDLNTIFTDPEGDQVTYKASSSHPNIASATVTGNALTIEMISDTALGQAIISITATDEKDGSNTITFEVNRPIFVASAISDITLSRESQTFILDLNTIFTDPEGDQVTYETSSSHPNIASATVTGNALTVEMISDTALGQAIISITATNEKDGSNTITFEVNRPPFVASAISDITLSRESQTFILDLNTIFTDPEGDQVTYETSSSHPNIASATVTGNALTVEMISDTALGQAIISITATNEKDGSNTITFEVNRPPFVTNAITDTTLSFDAGLNDRDLSQFFVDPEGDQLIFTVENSNNLVVIATLISDNILVFIPRDTGKAKVTLTASEKEKEGKTVITFDVIVRNSPNPLIRHSHITTHSISQAISIEAQISDDEGAIDRPILNFRSGGSPDFISVLMDTLHLSDTTFAATGIIPASAVTNRGLEYFIQARDNHDISSSLPVTGVFSVSVKVDGQGIRNTRPQPAGDSQTSYHIFSVPLELDHKSPEAIIVDDLGSYNINQWRFFDITTDPATGAVKKMEFPNTAKMTPGKAFWLIIKNSSRFIDTGPGTTIPTSEPFPITLSKGWNLIGNPFNFAAVAVDTFSDGRPLSFYAYESGQWTDPLTPAQKDFQPFEGYAVFCSTACTMFVNPDRFAIGNTLAKKETIPENEILWSVRIRAQCEKARDGNNVAAVVNGSSRAWDRMDHPEPPVIGEYVSVYFPHQEWSQFSKRYCTDFRPESEKGDEWEFEITTNIRDVVNLSFAGVESVPSEYDIWLIDKTLKITRNLRQHNSYSVAGRGSENPKRLTLLVGRPNYTDEKLTEYQLIPNTYELSQNFPNPFNPATTIQYGLPNHERVTLKVYNLLGEEVLTLVNNEQKEKGFHVAIWDGRNENGSIVASGIYIYRLTAGSFVMTKKMALVK